MLLRTMTFLFRYFVPQELQSTIAHEYRARVLVATCVVAVALLVPFLIARSWWQGITHAYTLTLIWAMLALQVTPFILRASRSVHVAGMFLTLNVVASGTVMCLTDGGLYSPTVIWLPTVPVMGLFFTTRRFSILIALALLASVLLLLVLHLTGQMPPSALDPRMVNFLHAGSMAAADEAEVGIQVQTPDPRLSLDVDPTRCRQIIVNLLTNAVRFSPAGSSIHVNADVTPAGEGEVCITDTGPGIPDAYAERVFERFFRLDEEHQDKGAGLGLFISRNLARLHGVDLTVDSTWGNGCRMILRLPADSHHEEHSVESAEGSSRG